MEAKLTTLFVPDALFGALLAADREDKPLYTKGAICFERAGNSFDDDAFFRMTIKSEPLDKDAAGLAYISLAYDVVKGGKTIVAGLLKDLPDIRHWHEAPVGLGDSGYAVKFHPLTADKLISQPVEAWGTTHQDLKNETSFCMPLIGLFADFRFDNRFGLAPLDNFRSLACIQFINGTTYYYDHAPQVALKNIFAMLHNEHMQEIFGRIHDKICWRYLTDKDLAEAKDIYEHPEQEAESTELGVVRITKRLMFSLKYVENVTPACIEIQPTISDPVNPVPYFSYYLPLTVLCGEKQDYEAMRIQLERAFASLIAQERLEDELDEPFLTAEDM